MEFFIELVRLRKNESVVTTNKRLSSGVEQTITLLERKNKLKEEILNIVTIKNLHYLMPLVYEKKDKSIISGRLFRSIRYCNIFLFISVWLFLIQILFKLRCSLF